MTKSKAPIYFEVHKDGPRYKRRAKVRMNNKKHTISRLKFGRGICNNVI